jgi:fumarate hydratase class I
MMLAKGNRSKQVVDACKKHRASIWLDRRPRRILARTRPQVEVLEYPATGMKRLAHQVEGFPAFIVTDDKGNDFFSEL